MSFRLRLTVLVSVAVAVTVVGTSCVVYFTDRSAVITQIEEYPAAKVLQILWVCGRLPRSWRSILRTLERWGEAKGCSEVETGGRFGWERQLAEEGYAAVPWTVLRKEL